VVVVVGQSIHKEGEETFQGDILSILDEVRAGNAVRKLLRGHKAARNMDSVEDKEGSIALVVAVGEEADTVGRGRDTEGHKDIPCMLLGKVGGVVPLI